MGSAGVPAGEGLAWLNPSSNPVKKSRIQKYRRPDKKVITHARKSPWPFSFLTNSDRTYIYERVIMKRDFEIYKTLFLVALVLTLLLPVLNAATIHVPADFPTIQTGIAAAAAADTVLVADGTYSGNGNIDISFLGKAITVLSENGQDFCIVDCDGFGKGFEFSEDETNTSILDGFTIRNGVSASGGGIDFYGGCSPEIRNCTIESCYAGNRGGGLYVNDSSPKIDNCVIQNNVCPAWVGGIGCYNAAPEITRCTIQNNKSETGGGIFLLGSTPVIGGTEMNGNYFADNQAGAGADLYCYSQPDTPVNAQGNVFAGYHHSDYYISPMAAFNLVDSVSQLNPILTDVYVSPSGDDSNNGLTMNTAFRTIHHALGSIYATEQNPLNVFLDSGTYSPTTTVGCMQSRFVIAKNSTAIAGGSVGSVSLDGAAVQSEFCMNCFNSRTLIIGVFCKFRLVDNHV